MGRLIDADKLSADMYHEAFEKDSDMQKWDSGCWIRYKMFENVLKAQPTVQPDTTTHDSIPAETGENDGDGTSGDCISRQAAYLALVEKGQASKRYKLGETWELNGEEIREVLDALPSAQPERKTGRWIPDNTDYYRTKFICSACGESEEVPTTGFGYGTMWDYCPMCGAKMEEGREDE